ncbi:tetratricopeptide repeat protein [Marivita sp. S2033]|uniref:tetratricopeptide repeat protein n=1 Tax=Marivita sp. S2033 TaxID=3373187 RepID=UPI00398241C8
MRHPFIVTLCVTGAFVLAGCERGIDTEAVDRQFQDVNAIDGTKLNDVMLTVSDPNEAVSYFQRASAAAPERLDLQRGLAVSLVRAKRYTEGVAAWARVVSDDAATDDDRVEMADALIRNNEWKRAETVLDAIPPTHETYKRYRLEAMIADGNQEWKKADSFYEIAVGLTTKPASVMNNWGFSKLTRGDYSGAERLFGQAIQNDDSLFTAKNNLVLARGAQGNYVLPVIPMTQEERAELLHSMGLAAVKRGDVVTGQGLMREAIDTHPQHFETAARSLKALESNVVN